MRQAIELEHPDYVFHLGDHDRDAEQISAEYPTLPMVWVRGNCDGWSDSPLTYVVDLGGVRFFLCHGHSFGVKSGYLRAAYAAMEQNADVLLFGHTHEAYLDDTGELTLLNPGSCGRWGRPTYASIRIEAGGPEIRLHEI